MISLQAVGASDGAGSTQQPTSKPEPELEIPGYAVTEILPAKDKKIELEISAYAVAEILPDKDTKIDAPVIISKYSMYRMCTNFKGT